MKMVRFESVPNRESGGAATANLGHRLGGSGPQTDNTIQSLRSAIERVDDSGFKYWEFDVHESADGVLFAFHDDEIESNGQMIPVKALTFAEIHECGKKFGISIPTLAEVVEELKERPEPTRIEIKNLMTDQARQAVIDVTEGRPDWKLMASLKRFQESFPKNSRRHWHSQVKKAGTKLVRVRRHEIDLFHVSRTEFHWILSKMKWKLGY